MAGVNKQSVYKYKLACIQGHVTGHIFSDWAKTMNVCPHWMNAATTTKIVAVVSAIFIASPQYYRATLYGSDVTKRGRRVAKATRFAWHSCVEHHQGVVSYNAPNLSNQTQET